MDLGRERHSKSVPCQPPEATPPCARGAGAKEPAPPAEGFDLSSGSKLIGGGGPRRTADWPGVPIAEESGAGVGRDRAALVDSLGIGLATMPGRGWSTIHGVNTGRVGTG
jgi:hypothetical protein